VTRSPSRFTGLAAVAVLWSTLGAATVRSGFPLLGGRPLSWLAADPGGALLFSAGLAGGALLLVAFHGHLRARYRASRSFSIAMLAGLAGQIVAAVVPIHGSPAAERVHTVAALTLGVSLPVLMWRFVVAQPPGRLRRLAKRLFWLEAAACAVGVALSRRSVGPLAEILPAAAFHVWVVALTVTSAGQDGPVRAAQPGGLDSEEGGHHPEDHRPPPAPDRPVAPGRGRHVPVRQEVAVAAVAGVEGDGVGGHRLVGVARQGEQGELFVGDRRFVADHQPVTGHRAIIAHRHAIATPGW
jgi:hypothetical protein